MSDEEKLLARMKQTKAGWVPDDLDKLYGGFGFEVREGHRHRIYIHPEYPNLRATVARHRKLAIGYIQFAIRLVEELKRLQGDKQNE